MSERELHKIPSTFMSTIEDVRLAEERLKAVLEAMSKGGTNTSSSLSQELITASEEYTKAVRELK